MNVSGNTVLITGGATGIGLALAAALVNQGNEVIICGRRRRKLQGAKAKIPSLQTWVCDVSKATSRHSLVRWATSSFKALNVLVNNAGIQQTIDFTKGPRDAHHAREEIEVNLIAPIQLVALLVPHLSRKKEAAIVNISSGLAFTPLAAVPVYSATKAAIHSLSLSLRHQLGATSIRVFEVAPPIVRTELGGRKRARKDAEGLVMTPDEVAGGVLEALARNQYEVALGAAKGLWEKREKLFDAINE